MKTDDLIAVLTNDAGPVDTGSLTRGTVMTALAGSIATAAAVVALLGARPDLSAVLMTPPVLAKLALGASVAGLALLAYQRSLRPGRRALAPLAFVLLPLLAVAAWALATLAGQAAGNWTGLIFGKSWGACLTAVTLLAMAPFAGFLALARRGATVRPRLTGIAAGAASAGLATVAYALHCPEDALPFVATWYPLAMGASAAIGALAAPRLLRW